MPVERDDSSDSSVLRIRKEPAFFSVNRLIWSPSVFSNVGTSCVRLHILYVVLVYAVNLSATTPWFGRVKIFRSSFLFLSKNTLWLSEDNIAGNKPFETLHQEKHLQIFGRQSHMNKSSTEKSSKLDEV